MRRGAPYPAYPLDSCCLAFALKGLVPHQPIQQRGVADSVMAADEEGIQCTGIGISDPGMLSQGAQLPERGRADLQQATHLTRTVHRCRIDPGLVEQLPELDFGPVQNFRVTLLTGNAPKTAGERL